MLIHARAPCTTSPSAVALIWSGLIGYWDCKKLVPLNIPQIANWAAVPPDSQSAPGPARQKRSVETGPTDAVVSKLLLSRGSVRPSSGQQLMTLILREVALVVSCSFLRECPNSPGSHIQDLKHKYRETFKTIRDMVDRNCITL